VVTSALSETIQEPAYKVGEEVTGSEQSLPEERWQNSYRMGVPHGRSSL